VFRQAIKADPDDLDMRCSWPTRCWRRQEQAAYSGSARRDRSRHLSADPTRRFWARAASAGLEQILRDLVAASENDKLRRQLARTLLATGRSISSRGRTPRRSRR
jgi:hypothetical protein